MIGREAYARPWLFATADSEIYGTEDMGLSRREVIERYLEYCDQEKEKISTWVLIRPILNFFCGVSGSREFRREINDQVNVKKTRDVREIVNIAMSHISPIALEERPSASSSSSSSSSRITEGEEETEE